jgi:nucleoside recognition membrane protein YjiH
MRSLILLSIFGISLAMIPIHVNAQQPEIYFQGNNTVVLRINNPYNASQWQDVDTYTAKGYMIMSIIPSSALEPDFNNPSLIFVVLQKFN